MKEVYVTHYQTATDEMFFKVCLQNTGTLQAVRFIEKLKLVPAFTDTGYFFSEPNNIILVFIMVQYIALFYNPV